MNFEKLSRRNFLKNSTILAVGVSSFSLFSGLSNALTYDGYLNKPCDNARIIGSCVADPAFFSVGYKCLVWCGGNLNGTHYYAWCAGPYKAGGGEWFRNIECKEYASEYD